MFQLQVPGLTAKHPKMSVAPPKHPTSHHCTLASPRTFLVLAKAFQKLPLNRLLPHPRGRGSLINVSVSCILQLAREFLNHTSNWLIFLSFQKCSMAPHFCQINYNVSTRIQSLIQYGSNLSLQRITFFSPTQTLYSSKIEHLVFITFSSIFSPLGHCFYFPLSGACLLILF